MNPEKIISIENRLSSLESKYDSINNIITGCKIDYQLFIKRKHKLAPGYATKVSFNQDGLIVGSDILSPSDIPLLDINKINGLKEILESKISTKELNNIKLNKEDILCHDIAIKTGIRINYDKYGLIVSSSELTINDIPELPLSHIKGLTENLEQLRNSIPSTDIFVHNITAAGSYAKVTIDNTGHVVYGSNLSMQDIPMELITKLNVIESILPTLASQKVVNDLIKSNSNKIDNAGKINPGIYTKVMVNSNGIVTNGEKLTINDIPELNIDNIKDLKILLNKKVDRSEIIDLQTSINTISTTFTNIGDINKLKKDIKNKADITEVKNIKSDITSLKNSISIIQNNMPSELISDQLKEILNEISKLSSRVQSIEDKLLSVD